MPRWATVLKFVIPRSEAEGPAVSLSGVANVPWANRLWGSVSPSTGRPGAPHPGFPVKLVGVDELHAAFLNESRTRRPRWVPRTGNSGISLVFREMWETTALSL